MMIDFIFSFVNDFRPVGLPASPFTSAAYNANRVSKHLGESGGLCYYYRSFRLVVGWFEYSKDI